MKSRTNLGAHSYYEEASTGIQNPLGELPFNGYRFRVPLLSLSQAQKIDVFIGKSKSARHEALSSATSLQVFDGNARTYNIHLKKEEGADSKETARSSKQQKVTCEDLDVTSDDVTPTPLRLLGGRCPLHDRALAEQMQSDVWPFHNRPMCCVELNTRKCNTSIGKVFVCNFIEESEETGVLVQCKYALCQRHYRGELSSLILAPLIGMYRTVVARGVTWFLVTILLLLANAFYTPFVKTALMILACDPFYQCYFTHCWKAGDRDFTLAVLMCVLMVGLYGLGFPLMMVSLLRRRITMLRTVFFAEEYEDRFTLPNGKVDMDQWRRYVLTDPTALGKMYTSFEMEWLYVPPIMLFWKAALLAPAVILEKGSFNRMLGVAVVQVSFGIFLFLTDASISPLVDLMYKLGVAHQTLILGMMAIDQNQHYTGGARLEKGAILVTLIYLALGGLCTLHTTVLPILMGVWEEKKITELLEKLGMQYTESTNLYVVPADEPIFTHPTKKRVAVETTCDGKAAEGDETGLEEVASDEEEEEDGNSGVLFVSQADEERLMREKREAELKAKQEAEHQRSSNVVVADALEIDDFQSMILRKISFSGVQSKCRSTVYDGLKFSDTINRAETVGDLSVSQSGGQPKEDEPSTRN